MAFTVIYDANVLFPAPLRDLLIRISITGVVRARWTEEILDDAQAAGPGLVFALQTHGTYFGKVISLGGGKVRLKLDGIGFPPSPDSISAEEPSPEEQLVVRPFARKGENFSMRDFDRGAMQFHFGMQPVELPDVGWFVDEDNDGVVNEVTVFEMSALHIFDVMNPSM